MVEFRHPPASREELEILTRELRRHARLYYEEAAPELPDGEYDRLLALLQAAEHEHPEWAAEDSPTRRVGSGRAVGPGGGTEGSGLPQIRHEPRLYSLSNVYTDEELADFDRRVREGLAGIVPASEGPDSQGPLFASAPAPLDIGYSCELKLDGVSISLVYEAGRLVLAATRGDGEWGEDITLQARCLANLPARLTLPSPPARLVARGEVVMEHAAFQGVNARRAEAGERLFANPRNAAAGSLKLLDLAELRRRGLKAFLYEVASLSDGPEPQSQMEVLDWLAAAGLPVFPHAKACAGLTEVRTYCLEWEDGRLALPLDTDGVVVKLDALAPRTSLGWTAKVPRWAVARKFGSLAVPTRLLSITWQVGRTGVLTPVAELEPVEVQGSTISRATLHNEDEIRRRGIRPGMLVWVEKGGDVIPKVTGPAEDATGLPEPDWPTVCPECAHELTREEDEAARRCPNPACPAVRQAAVEHFVARPAMDVDGLGERLVAELIRLGHLGTVADLYHLDLSHLLECDRMGEKTAAKLMTAIDESRRREPSRLLFALGIRGVGARAARTLLKHAGNLRTLADLPGEELQVLDGVGPRRAGSLRIWFDLPENRALLARLEAGGIDLDAGESGAHRAVAESPFAGKRIVLTGTLATLDRHEARSLLESLGARVSTSVTARTNLVIVGEGAGSKLEKAINGGLPIMSEREFLDVLKSINAKEVEKP